MYKLVTESGHVAMYGEFSVLAVTKDEWANRWPHLELSIEEAI